MSTSNVLQTIQ